MKIDTQTNIREINQPKQRHFLQSAYAQRPMDPWLCDPIIGTIYVPSP